MFLAFSQKVQQVLCAWKITNDFGSTNCHNIAYNCASIFLQLVWLFLGTSLALLVKCSSNPWPINHNNWSTPRGGVGSIQFFRIVEIPEIMEEKILLESVDLGVSILRIGVSCCCFFLKIKIKIKIKILHVKKRGEKKKVFWVYGGLEQEEEIKITTPVDSSMWGSGMTGSGQFWASNSDSKLGFSWFWVQIDVFVGFLFLDGGQLWWVGEKGLDTVYSGWDAKNVDSYLRNNRVDRWCCLEENAANAEAERWCWKWGCRIQKHRQ